MDNSPKQIDCIDQYRYQMHKEFGKDCKDQYSVTRISGFNLFEQEHESVSRQHLRVLKTR